MWTFSCQKVFFFFFSHFFVLGIFFFAWLLIEKGLLWRNQTAGTDSVSIREGKKWRGEPSCLSLKKSEDGSWKLVQKQWFFLYFFSQKKTNLQHKCVFCILLHLRDYFLKSTLTHGWDAGLKMKKIQRIFLVKSHWKGLEALLKGTSPASQPVVPQCCPPVKEAESPWSSLPSCRPSVHPGHGPTK